MHGTNDPRLLLTSGHSQLKNHTKDEISESITKPRLCNVASSNWNIVDTNADYMRFCLI